MTKQDQNHKFATKTNTAMYRKENGLRRTYRDSIFSSQSSR